MSGTTETTARKFDFAPPSERSTELWRALLGLDRTVRARWTLNEEVRAKATPDRSPRPLVGANADVWKRVMAVRGDSAAMADARVRQADDAAKTDIEQLRNWLLSDSLDWDAIEHVRDEGWR